MIGFKDPTIVRLYQLYQENKDKEMGGVIAPLWKIVSPSIPDLLAGLDMDAELFGAVKSFVIKLAEVMKEDGS